MRKKKKYKQETKKTSRRWPGPVVVGRLSMNTLGYGFVCTEADGPDILIRNRNLSTALHGDEVKASVRRGRNRLEGQIVEILKRGKHFVTGTLYKSGKTSWIEPSDSRYPKLIALTNKNEIKPASGTRVIAKICQFSDISHHHPTASILKTFDPAQPVQFELDMILLREGIETEFPEATIHQTERLPRSVSKKEKSQREDLRALELITIDPKDARDHDDAVWATKLRDGGFRVIIAISDVSHYVQPKSPLDRAALARGCTVYLPDRSVPMLPEHLCSNLASLVPNRDRLALAVEVFLGPKGAIRSHRLIEGVIRSKARIHYEGVARALGLSQTAKRQPAAETRIPLLETLLEAAQILHRRRVRRGALMFDLKEPRILLDSRGEKPVDIKPSPDDPGVAQAYNLIEELMLLANQVVAQTLTKNNYPTIYRIHPKPDDQQINTFAETAHSLGYDLAKDTAEKPKKLNRFLKNIESPSHLQILENLLLRAMQQARYSTENQGHYALALQHYLHFTSPIRRYPDLAVHRLVRALIQKRRIKSNYMLDRLNKAAHESSRLERRAMNVEREVSDLYKALLMQDHIGEVFDATIVTIAEHGFFSCLDRFFVDVLCRFTSLSDDKYMRDAHGLKLTGMRTGKTYAIGDRIRVRISDVSIVHRQITALPEDLSYSNRTSQTARRSRSKNKKSRKRSRES